MKNIFLLIGVFPICYELLVLLNPQRAFDFQQTIKCGGLLKERNVFILLMTGYLLWLCAGLFTAQWSALLCMILMCFLKKESRSILVFDAIFSLIMLAIIYTKYFYENP